MDELNDFREEVKGVDLESPFFHGDAYEQLKTVIRTNKDRLPHLEIRDPHILIRTEPDMDVWKIWIPEPLTGELIAEAHNPPLASHPGIAKTVEHLRRYFFWPRMSTQIRDFISNCSTCKETKSPNQTLRPPMGAQILVEHPWQFLYTDLLGPYPRSKAGNSYILVVLDKFSKFVLLKPLKRATAQEIVKFLESEVFHVFGVPKTLFSDNGVQYRSKELKSLLEKYGIGHMTTATHAPQANASERVNQSILAAIRAYIESDQTMWDANLSSIASALRNRVHDSTGFTPYYVVFGQHFIQHGSVHKILQRLNDLPASTVEILPPSDFRETIHQQVKLNLESAQKRHENTYNTRCRSSEFRPGQEVYHRAFFQSNFKKNFNAKLAKKWIPARIVSRVGSSMYVLEDRQGEPITMTYHAKDLRV